MVFAVRRVSGAPREARPAVQLVLLAGYTGRDQDVVRAHVEELAAHGVAAPKRVPAVYAVPPTRLVTTGEIAVHGRQTAGEAEFVLLSHWGRVLVGVGSDHTDRELEAHSVVKAKQVCDKPVSGQLWELDEVVEHWDRLGLRSEVETDGGWQPYQDGSVADLLPPAEVLKQVEAAAGRSVADAAVFSGTLPLIGGEFRPGTAFRAVLEDPVLQRRLVCEYRVRQLPDIDC
jgi:hypothetical protein